MGSKRERLANSIFRWRIARQLTLAGIILGAAVSTAAVSSYHVASKQSEFAYRVARVHTYKGVGIQIGQRGEHFVVERVFANTPADGKVFPRAVLVSADGKPGTSLIEWGRMVRGEVGTSVKLEVAYPGSGCPGRNHQVVELQRDVIRVSY